MPRLDLENSLKQVSVMAAEPTKEISIKFDSGNVFFMASTPDLGEANDTLAIDFQGEEIEFHLNSNFIFDVIKSLKGEKISIAYSSNSSPVGLLDPEDKKFISIYNAIKKIDILPKSLAL